jgi:hypothetical protein
MRVMPPNEESLEADEKAEKLVSELTLEEKFLLLANHNESVYFSSTPIARLGIPPMDGILRKENALVFQPQLV